MNCGVYKIVNKVNGKFYIGSSVNIKHRWSVHKTYLRKGTHDNPILQATWNKYSSRNLELEIVEYTKDFLNREQYYLDNLNPEYNIAQVVGTSANLGRRFTKQHKRRLSKSNGQFSDDQLISIIDKILLGFTAGAIAKEFGVKRKVIDEIKHNHRYRHLNYKREEAKNTKSSIHNFSRGENRYNTPLSNEDVKAIRKLRQEGKLLRELAERFGVTVSTISNICLGKSWKNYARHPRSL